MDPAAKKTILSTILFLWILFLIGMLIFAPGESTLPIWLYPTLVLAVLWAVRDRHGLLSGPIAIRKGIRWISDVLSGNNVVCPKCGHNTPRSGDTCRHCEFRLEKLAELPVTTRISYLLNDASPTDRAAWVNVRQLLNERNQLELAIGNASEEHQRALESILHWSNASDPDSADMGVYWSERRAEDTGAKLSKLEAKLPILDTNLEQLIARLESSVSKNTDEFYVARAEGILKQL